MLRKVGLLTAIVAVLFAFVLGAGSAAAQAGTQLSIEPNAQWGHNFLGVDVQLHVACEGSFGGFVNVMATQSPPENNFPTTGNGGSPVFCDGRQHQIGVTVNGFGFDIGKAFAVATLCTMSGCPAATASRTINITF
jgi:hypothetical protein